MGSHPQAPKTMVKAHKSRTEDAAGAAPCGLLDCVVMQPELFNELVQFLPPLDLARACDALELSHAVRPILFEEKRWVRLIQEHCGVDMSGSRPLQVQHLVKARSGCKALADYVNLRGQLKTFQTNVLVLVGDLGQIERIGGHKIDCFVFPTPTTYRDPGVGVSGRIHARAGPELDQWISNRPPTNSTHVRYDRSGSVLLTPGFGTGAQLLVHCVGPYHRAAQRDQILYTTYVNALVAIKQSATPIQCAVIASISTGAMGFPVNAAARIAMCAVRDVIRTREWMATLAFACFDERTYNEFVSAKDEVLTDFHVSALAYPQALGSQRLL